MGIDKSEDLIIRHVEAAHLAAVVAPAIDAPGARCARMENDTASTDGFIFPHVPPETGGYSLRALWSYGGYGRSPC